MWGSEGVQSPASGGGHGWLPRGDRAEGVGGGTSLPELVVTFCGLRGQGRGGRALF